jgi:CTP:molybdopterin cytidylyltransferase MocA
VADQPNLKASTVEQLTKAFEREPDCIWAPEAGGKRGNPVLFPASLFEELLNVTGDRGGRQVIAAHEDLLRTVAVPPEELRDIDTKEDMQSC